MANLSKIIFFSILTMQNCSEFVTRNFKTLQLSPLLFFFLRMVENQNKELHLVLYFYSLNRVEMDLSDYDGAISEMEMELLAI